MPRPALVVVNIISPGVALPSGLACNAIDSSFIIRLHVFLSKPYCYEEQVEGVYRTRVGGSGSDRQKPPTVLLYRMSIPPARSSPAFERLLSFFKHCLPAGVITAIDIALPRIRLLKSGF